MNMNRKLMPDLSMTKVEELLRQYWNDTHKDYNAKILSPKELDEYISKMLMDFLPRNDIMLSPDELPDFLTHNKNLPLPQLLANDPKIQRSHDTLSVTRMLRFMPPCRERIGYFKIYYALSGVCTLYIGSDTVEVSPGTVIIAAPDTLCAAECFSESGVLLAFSMRQNTFERVFWKQLEEGGNLLASTFRKALERSGTASFIYFETDADIELYYILCKIYMEYFHPKAYGSQLLNALMSEFSASLVKNYAASARIPKGPDFFWKQEFSAILDFIQKNYASTTIDEVAARFDYSRRQIGRIVKSCTGQSYADLTYRLRMENAAKLLQLGTPDYEKIATASGYSTLSSFYRAFTNYYNCTPGEYRQKHIAM